MLATLNLQLVAVELPDDTLNTTAKLLPDQGVEPVAGFADLLSLRVADAQIQSPVSGDLLPPAGSQLPVLADADSLPLSIEAGPAGNVLPDLPVQELLPVDEIDVGIDFDIALESEVLYRPELQSLDVAADSTPITPAAMPGRIDTAIAPTTLDVDGADLAGQPVVAPRPELMQSAALAANQRGAMTQGMQPADTATTDRIARERTPTNLTQAAAVQTAADKLAAPPPETERALPISPELFRRPEPTASQRADAVAQAVTELVRPRPIVNQTVQTLQSQLNPQQSPVFFNPVSTPLAATDITYSAAAQQATDLIGTPVRDAIWGERLGERVVMMAGNQMKSVEIRLTPAELGPLRVQVAVEDGATNVTFHAQHALTRDAIEQALPRLRDMLAENGLSLGDAHVGGEGVAEGHRDAQSETGVSGRAADEGQGDVGAESSTTTHTRITGAGLVDTFA